jgi:hypothetical protein
MDGRQFDRITRALAGEQSRRSALKKAIALIAGAGAVAGTEPAGAARLLGPAKSMPVRPDPLQWRVLSRVDDRMLRRPALPGGAVCAEWGMLRRGNDALSRIVLRGIMPWRRVLLARCRVSVQSRRRIDLLRGPRELLHRRRLRDAVRSLPASPLRLRELHNRSSGRSHTL